jgi:hypothetical protein
MRDIKEIKAEYMDCLNCKSAFDCLSAMSECQKRFNIEHYHFEYLRAITADIPLSELETMCTAWKDGRCVVLPCKVGDTVYKFPPFPEEDGSVYADWFEYNDIPDFGKTVFLARKAAEAALERLAPQFGSNQTEAALETDQ